MTGIEKTTTTTTTNNNNNTVIKCDGKIKIKTLEYVSL